MASFLGSAWGWLGRGRMVRAGLTVVMVLACGGGRPLTAQVVTAALGVQTAPSAEAVNPATNEVYVANYGNGTVSVIDGATDTVVQKVTVGTEPSAVAVNPVTNEIYVANYGSGTVSVIDGATNAVTARVRVGNDPDAVAVNPVTDQIYVANYGGTTVTVINGGDNTVAGTVTVGSAPNAVAVNPVTGKVYVANIGSNNVTVIDGTNLGATPATVTVGNSPSVVAVNAVTDEVYVVNSGDETVAVINGATNAVAATVGVGSSPDAEAVNPVTNEVYVVNSASNSVTVINGATNSVVATVGVGSNPSEVAVNAVTDQVYVANRGSDNVTVIEGGNLTATPVTLTVGSDPLAVAVNPVTNQVYVANNASDTVSVISGNGNPITTLTAGTNPDAVGLNPVTGRVYVANETSGTVSVINGATASVIAAVAVGTTPNGVAVNPVTNQVYVINRGNNTLTVISGATNTVTATVALGSSPFAVAVNPVTNQVYVTNNATTGLVWVIDGNSGSLIATVPVGINPCGLAVDPVSNQVYVANNQGGVSVIDGTTNMVTATVSVGMRNYPYMVAVNPVTNQIYVANQGGPGVAGSVSVIDGPSQTLVVTVPVGIEPYAVAVNSATNRVYVANYGSGTAASTVSVIDGVSNMVTATVGVGIGPYALAVNPVTNQIYVANSSGSKVTVIDGASSLNSGVVVEKSPNALAVNPLTGQVYVADYGSAAVSVIDADGTGGQQTVPINVSTAPPATDSLTVALPNSGLGTPYITMNPAPTLTATVNSVYAASSTYSGDTTQTAGSPLPTALYYQVDGGSGLWSQATVTGATRSNPATFSLPLTGQVAGVHTLYLYAAYGNEGVPDSSVGGTGNSPEISNVTGYTFAVLPVPTTTALIADQNPQAPNARVTFTATVSSPPGATVATGVVSFYDSASGTPVLLGTESLGEVGGSDIASLQWSFTATGSHPIMAVYDGDPNHAGSVGNRNEIIDTLTLTPATLPPATVGVAYSETLGASGGASGAIYTYASSPGSLPAGLGLSPSRGLSGTPTAAGDFSFTVTATENGNSSLTGSQTYALAVGAPTLTLTPASGILHAIAGTVYSQTFTASGGTWPYTYSINTGALPAGLSLNGATGVISGTATASGTFSFTVRAEDSSTGTGSPFFATNNYTLIVAAPTLTLTPATLPAPTVGVGYSQRVSASGGVGTYSYAVSAGALPAGLTLSTGGMVSGTATVAGSYSFSVKATDSDGFTAAQGYTLTVARQASQTVVSANASAATPVQTVTLTAAVSATVAGTSVVPTGTVTFLDNGTQVGTATLSGGSATLVVPNLPAGATAVITATYAGDGNFLPSASGNSATVGVSAFDFSFSNTGTAAYTAAQGAAATYNFAVAPLYGSYAGTVSFRVAGLPVGATASFTPGTVAVGGGETPVTMTVQTASATAENQGRPLRGGIVLALLFLPFAAKRRMRGKLGGRMLLVVLMMAGVTATLTGCGEDRAVVILHPQSYTLTVTASSGTLQHTQSVTLTVE